MRTLALSRMAEKMPSVFTDLFPWNDGFNESFFGREFNIPAVNITDEKDEFKVSLAAPGLKKEDFKIDLDGNLLKISAEKEEKKDEKEKNYTRKEYNYSSFERSFTLPDDVVKEKIEAKYEDGVLKLVLPKKEEAKKAMISKHIPVK